MPEKDDDCFVVAVKRERRGQAPADWQERVRATPGVTTVGGASSERMQIEATPQALETLQRQLGDDLYIEPLIRHRRL